MTEIEEAQEIQITVMMAADGAQAVSGKLYILGGGFDHLSMPTQPFAHRFDLAILVSVPWTRANEPFQLVVEQLDADGEPCGYRAEAQMETGRPAGMRRGTSFSVPIALPVVAETSGIEPPSAELGILAGADDGFEGASTLATDILDAPANADVEVEIEAAVPVAEEIAGDDPADDTFAAGGE